MLWRAATCRTVPPTDTCCCTSVSHAQELLPKDNTFEPDPLSVWRPQSCLHVAYHDVLRHVAYHDALRAPTAMLPDFRNISVGH
eukprot:4148838-Amphidinium_carterae.1